jgi:ubiquinone/menaquinone biosynthesis C-methylase UbiE
VAAYLEVALPGKGNTVDDHATEPRPETWTRGRKTDEVERSLVSYLLAGRAGGRLIDVGTGTGRLLPALEPFPGRIVAIDRAREFLEVARKRGGIPRADFVRADGRRLPVRGRAADVVLLIRTVHRFADPLSVLSEIQRVLRPGGRLLISYSVRRSLKTVEHAIWDSLKRTRRRPDSLRAADRSPWSEPAPAVWAVSSRRRFHQEIRNSGFILEREIGCGFEDLPGLSRLPASIFLSAARSFGSMPWFPHWFAVLRAVERPTPTGPSDQSRNPAPDEPKD